MKNHEYPRDMVGYKNQPPHPNWPGGAKLAVQFVLEKNRERVLFDPTFKYIRDMIMRTTAHDEDKEDKDSLINSI
mgnify:CR=1 FL=1